MSDVKNKKLAADGKRKIEWANNQMPVVRLIREDFQKKKPLKGLKVSACLHVTSETANLMRTLKAGGAAVVLCASNPLSTQDEVAASLVADFGIPTFAIKGEDNKTYYRHINSALDHHPAVTMDDGADLISELHKNRRTQLKQVIGGTEETTTGVIRLRSMEKKKVLAFPIIAVNDALTKHFFDNRYGTGQSTIDGILRATNILLAGKNFVIFGYGFCGRGVATRARGLGAKVIVVEVDPLKALEATMDGFEVMPSKEAARIGDIFVTVSGNINVLRKEHFQVMKDGAILANTGHFNVEINIPALEKMSAGRKKARPFVEEFTLKGGRRLFLLGEGRLINLAAAEGHPADVMDMSFANQALSVKFLAEKGRRLEKKVYQVPDEIDSWIAALKLKTMGIKIDRMTPLQKKYLEGWEAGT
jgi:adenosylhomocysteinase